MPEGTHADSLTLALTRLQAATSRDGAAALTQQLARELTGAATSALWLHDAARETLLFHSGSGLGEHDRTGDADDRVTQLLPARGKIAGELLLGGLRGPLSAAQTETLAAFAVAAGAVLDGFALDAARAEYVAHITHEFRLPMTSIKGYAALLGQGMGGDLSEMQQQFVGVIARNIERMSVFASDLSDISRLERGKLKVSPAIVAAGEVLDEAWTKAAPCFAERQHDATRTVANDLPTVEIDPAYLRLILERLLDNACRYTAPGGQIRVTATADNGELRLAVHDNGAGISPDDLAHLFEPFFRSSDTAVREHSGWGLSLHLCRKLAWLFGGDLHVESRAGEGSTFTLVLPVQ